jgi:hypothetical protein
MTNGHLAFFISIASIVPVLFLALAVDARRRSDAIAAHRTVPVPTLRVTAVYELVAVIALASAEIIALHAIYRGHGGRSGTAAVVVLLAYAGYIIAAPWVTRAIRSTWGHPEPSLPLIAWTMTLGGVVALGVALVVVATLHAEWWVILLAAIPLAVAAVFISAGQRSRLARLVPQGADESAG